MKYITLEDLSKTIRTNLWKIPRDIDFIMGVPRSGTICASIISEFLNVPLIDIDSFVGGIKPYGGGRLRHFYGNKKQETKRVLVVDDTVYTGLSKVQAKEKLAPFTDYQFIFMAVYLEGPGEKYIDLYLEDVRKYTKGFTEIVYYEWNIFHHNEGDMSGFLFDLDGVMCLDPPDERQEEEYNAFIKSAPPLFLPSTKIGGIATYRLDKNREITEKWLADHGVNYGLLYMFNAQSWDERNAMGISPEQMKSFIYGNSPQYKLYIESNKHQAEKIHEMTGKPVLCTENNKLYGGDE